MPFLLFLALHYKKYLCNPMLNMIHYFHFNAKLHYVL